MPVSQILARDINEAAIAKQLLASVTQEIVADSPDVTRSALSLLDLRTVGAEAVEHADIDLAVWNATGDLHLATLFSRAA